MPALSVDSRVGISRSASETDVKVPFSYYVSVTLKLIFFHSSFLVYLSFYVA